MPAPGFTAGCSLYPSRGRYRASAAAVGRPGPGLALAQDAIAPITKGTTSAPAPGDTCHLVTHWFADNECGGDCRVSGGRCIPTDYRLKTLSDIFLHESDTYVLGPNDYEPSACGCVGPKPQLAPAPPAAPAPPEPPGPPVVGDWFWVVWALGGWMVEPDPPWEPPGGHQPPRHELEPGESFRPWEKFEPREWLGRPR